MQIQPIIRGTGVAFVCLGAGTMIWAWLEAKEFLRMAGQGPEKFIESAFLGRPISLTLTIWS
jgi:hypothetical protein